MTSTLSPMTTSLRRIARFGARGDPKFDVPVRETFIWDLGRAAPTRALLMNNHRLRNQRCEHCPIAVKAGFREPVRDCLFSARLR
ncbi:hypothetical protein IY145_15450 [Methylosinus sp. H3A]|uniref:hypothetical protein n=1 Tax=Methylosinus sp. H3A TaxID=2785786 RepID=UPI0018C2B35D|nr:hypothetical protein [Methylosinus sp. H3A]MBG0810767.1 hypothetical protein [Methylosinus sp. H3A]